MIFIASKSPYHTASFCFDYIYNISFYIFIYSLCSKNNRNETIWIWYSVIYWTVIMLIDFCITTNRPYNKLLKFYDI